MFRFMLDIIGHFCFLIFAQGKWKDKYTAKLVTEIKKDFFEILDRWVYTLGF